jgi:hypothetical protein
MEILLSQHQFKNNVLTKNGHIHSIALTKPTFDIRSLMRELSENYCDLSNDLFKDVLLVGIQHILETTVDMLAIMKELGLRDCIIGGKNIPLI